MATVNSKGSASVRNFVYPAKHSLLPPKNPFPSVSSAYVDYLIPNPLNGSKAVQKPGFVQPRHLRTSSESFLIEDQPSWLDDLLSEPETPVEKGGHRRSSSDSFAYLDVGNLSGQHFADQEGYKWRNVSTVPSWRSQDYDCHKEGWRAPFIAEAHLVKQKNRIAALSSTAVAHYTGFPSFRDDLAGKGTGVPVPSQEAVHDAKQKQDQDEFRILNSKASSDSKEASQAKTSAPDTDAKRSKQQFAQRSRVRKLQYIAELERNVQALQAEGSEVMAELEFLNQKNLILSMENNALKYRLESLAQEKRIKYFEHEVLERKMVRLRALYQQQQQQPQQKQPSSSHRRSSSKDLDSQFSILSLKHKDQNPDTDKVG
ncbi:hypothetical protein SAY87_018800 [Trapa incisa]|uniref:BZIP domain-containing protein n=1 Tax=Trapa incisa TaxID=236973 RepID=A0AAN7K3F5_9MYRT|nr:hypothetical protein SAY87_018800 [Trapa incisa]